MLLSSSAMDLIDLRRLELEHRVAMRAPSDFASAVHAGQASILPFCHSIRCDVRYTHYARSRGVGFRLSRGGFF